MAQTNGTAVINALTPKSYNFRHLPRTEIRGGGVGVLYKSSFHLCSSMPLSATSFEGLELALRVGKAGSAIRIVTVYRPPSTGRKSVSFQTFIDEFSIVVERCATRQTDCDSITSNTRKFTELLQEANVKQHVREPTHVGDHILDLVITRNSHNIISSTSVETLLTKHHVIRCDLVTVKPKRPKRHIRYRKYTPIDNAKLVSDLRNADLFNNPNDGVDELSAQYKSTIDGLIDSHAPLITRVIIIRPKTPRYNTKLSDAKRQLRRAKRRWRQTRLLLHRDIYTNLRDVYREKLVAAKSSFFCEKIRESACDVKAMYRVTNEITGRKQPPVLPECNDTHEDLAERFQVYFSEKIMNVHNTMYHHDAHYLCCQLMTITTTTIVLCQHSHPQLPLLLFDY